MSPFLRSTRLSPKKARQRTSSFLPFAGDDGIRTHDPLLAGQVLSQLSYTPMSGSSRQLFFRFGCFPLRGSVRILGRLPAACHPFRSLHANAVLIPTELHPHVSSSSVSNEPRGSLKIEQQRFLRTPICGTRVIPQPFSLERR